MSKKSTKKKHIFPKFLLSILLIAIMVAGVFFGIILFRPNKVAPYELTSTVSTVNFHTDLQRKYLDGKFYWYISPYANGTQELSRPKAVNVTWETTLPEVGYRAVFSEYEDMHDSFSYSLDSLPSVDVYNLKIGTTYYCQIYSPLNTPYSEKITLTTATQAPRNMYVDGVTNVRDLGGWAIPGGRVKQGLIYRCGRLNENKEETPVLKITEKGIDTMLHEMKIKSEMDLRKVDDNEVGGLTDKSVLGDTVTYFQCPMGYNGNMLTNNTEMVRHIFSDILSKKENYPLIFHCSIGTDRTGMIAFLINGLLGVDINDLYRDYLFSNFGDIGGDRNIMDTTFNYVSTIQWAKGKTVSEKIENYLLSIGVKQEEINSVRDILSEKA